MMDGLITYAYEDDEDQTDLCDVSDGHIFVICRLVLKFQEKSHNGEDQQDTKATTSYAAISVKTYSGCGV